MSTVICDPFYGQDVDHVQASGANSIGSVMCPASGLAKIAGKPALYSLANSSANFYQVDTLGKLVVMKDEF
jgi:hypothetical protein